MLVFHKIIPLNLFMRVFFKYKESQKFGGEAVIVLTLPAFDSLLSELSLNLFFLF